ncbi:thyroid hormone-induced protein B-like [Mytilus edulis]
MNGISGNHCQTKTDMYGNQCPFNPCSRLPCKNNGICRVDGSSYTCTCTSGSFGTDCEDLKCDFEIKEDPNCFLQQDLSDDANWMHWSGKTPTSQTGPEAAYEGCYYYYFETSNPLRSGAKSRLISKNLDIDVNRCLTFTYHMYGEHMGTLNIYQMSDLKWTRSGNQNNSWKLDKIHLDEKLTDSKGYSKITFEAIRGTSYLSDIAIDNVKILTC